MTWIHWIYLAMSVVTLATYGYDKLAARAGRRRVHESTLHLLSLFGGWPGALVAMPLFRHKRQKTGFVLITFAIAALHIGVWAWVRLGR